MSSSELMETLAPARDATALVDMRIALPLHNETHAQLFQSIRNEFPELVPIIEPQYELETMKVDEDNRVRMIRVLNTTIVP